MDVLSEVLKAVKLEGALFFNAEFSAPWCLRSSGPAMAPFLSPSGGSPSGGHLILYHFLTEGRAYVRLPGGRREELAAGDIVILPHGDIHLLGNGSPEKPVDSVKTFAKNVTQGLKTAHFGGGGETTRFVCGYMVCDRQLGEVFLAGLPKILKIHVTDEPSGQWLEHSIRFTVGEVNGIHAGSGLVLAKLSELLFVETLRRYINALPPDRTGWLAGTRDAVVGRAMALLHNDPSLPWTIEDLARQVGLSRTGLTTRFRHFLNESPIAYLAQWRLQLAADLLRSTEDNAAQIALAVGYNSEAAFNRAFKRKFDCPPAQFRRRTR